MSYINQYLLADPRLYKNLLDQVKGLLHGISIDLDSDLLQRITYSSWQQRHYHWPDQVFYGHWKNFEKRKTEENGWCNALLGQAARYHFVDDDRRLSIHAGKFDEWQGWISNQTGLPVISYQLKSQLNRKYFENSHDLYLEIKSKLGLRSLVSPYHPLVEDYIDQNGLHETHLHLNGTTLLEQLWHHSLIHPEEIIENLIEEYQSNDRVKLLYASNPYLSNPKEFYELLLIARNIRELLLSWLEGDDSALVNNKIRLCNILKVKEYIDTTFEFETKQFDVRSCYVHISEVHWQARVQYKLAESPSSLMDGCYLLYLLCMNCFQRLLVQRSDQYGFDQFQKFADDGVRENIESEYSSRFFQLHGPRLTGKPDLATLEGRFAPKKTLEKNEKLIRKIITGFLDYSEGESPVVHHDDLNSLSKRVKKITRPKFSLVAHFIKQPWSPSLGGSHYEALRAGLIDQGAALEQLFDAYPYLREVITGIDAAGNELDAPPEVFASFYRFCRYKGFKNFTYHVGEDFEHLLSGIRAVYDAVFLLDLKNGDRIGHGTAIGISPELWLKSMPDKIYLKRGEWLDNLLFLRKVALSEKGLNLSLNWIENQIHEISFNIFGSKIDLFTLQASFELRGLASDVVKDYLGSDTLAKTGWLFDEVKLIQKLSNNSLGPLKLLKCRWFDDAILHASSELVELDLSRLSADILIQLQQYVQKKIVDSHVVVETLPTSNVRISHYKSINEHHVFRWLGVDTRKLEGDSNMLITLGSDDPGIFATDMRNEFYHIFGVLRSEFNYSPHDALSCVARLNDNGRIYRFNNDTIQQNIDSEGMGLKS